MVIDLAMIHLDGDSLTLDDLVAIAYDAAPVGLADAARARVRAARAVVDDFAQRDDADLRHQHRLRQLRRGADPARLARRSCRSICCAATPPASASRCRCPSSARRWRCAPTCWRRASPASGSRRSSCCVELLNRRRPSGRAVARIGGRERRPGAAGAPGAGADRRRRSVARRRRASLAPRRCARAGLTPVTLGAEGRARAHQRHAGVDGAARPGARRRRAAGARGRHRGRAEHRRPAGLDQAVRRRGFTRPAASPASANPPPTCRRCSPAARSTPPTPTAGASRTPIRCGARRRCTAPRATPSRLRAGRSTTEANAATDNPMVFADAARDRLRRQLSRRAGGGRRRRAVPRRSRSWPRSASGDRDRLVNPALSGLPAFLTRHGGLQSGLMMAQVTAAALTSELKTLAHPASVDTIPTSGNKEDHVSMSMARGAEGGARARARATGDRRRAAVRVPGDRSARAARLVAAADARA